MAPSSYSSLPNRSTPTKHGVSRQWVFLLVCVALCLIQFHVTEPLHSWGSISNKLPQQQQQQQQQQQHTARDHVSDDYSFHSFSSAVAALPRHLQCVSLEDDLDRLLVSNRQQKEAGSSNSTVYDDGHRQQHQQQQVFLFMAAKAGGTSLKRFATECARARPSRSTTMKGYVESRDNFMANPDAWKAFLMANLEPPKIIVSHLLEDSMPMIHVMRHMTPRQSIIIYVYRPETDRLVSAIHFVVRTRLCARTQPWLHRKYFGNVSKSVFGLQMDDETCIVDEKALVEHLIQPKVAEIGFSIPAQLTCQLWEEINDTAPTILFVDSSQLDALQAKLAQHYCPTVTAQKTNVKTVEAVATRRRLAVEKREDNDSSNNNNMVDAKNAASSTTSATTPKYMVKLENPPGGSSGTAVIPLEDWLQAKRATMEFALQLYSVGAPSDHRNIVARSGSNNAVGSCKYKTRQLEEALEFCPDRMLQVFSNKE